MQIIKKILTFTVFASTQLAIAAEAICPPMPAAVTNVNRDVVSDIQIGVGSLGKIRLAELSVKTEVVANQILQRHKNIDRMVALQTMAATYCLLLRSSGGLSDADRLARWERFQDKVLQIQDTVPSASKAALPSTSSPAPEPSKTIESDPNRRISDIARNLVTNAEQEMKPQPLTPEQIQLAGGILALHMSMNRAFIGTDPNDPPEAEDAFARATWLMTPPGGMKKNPEKAIPYLNHALKLRESSLGSKHKLVGKTHAQLAIAYFDVGNQIEGQRSAERAKDILGMK